MNVSVVVLVLALLQVVVGETAPNNPGPRTEQCVCSPAIYVDYGDKKGEEADSKVLYQLRTQLTLLQGSMESLRTQQEILIDEVSNLTAELLKKAEPEKPVCPDGYVQFEDRCFNFSIEKKTYTDARSACQAAGGRLGMPKDQLTNDFLTNQIETRYFAFSRYIVWFGLTDEVREGTWVWEDGTPLIGWSDWAQGEPDDFFNQDCVGFGSRFGLKWEDGGCSLDTYYVCETKATFPPVDY
ncbi:perlucin-like protein [Branchiostoma lanceolatum]|uniref:perlucin-like protein n=1 Tax=Branchiostoma lanceolatum TaxID=7740 RepID=UPI0034548A84